MEPIQAILAIVALVRAGKHAEAVPMILRLIASLWEAYYPAQRDGFASLSGFSNSDRGLGQLCDELQAHADRPGGLAGPSDWLPVVLPILFELVRKLVEEIYKPK